MTEEIRSLQADIDILIDKLDRNSAHFESDRRERDEIRAGAIALIQRRDMLLAQQRDTA